MGDGHQGAAIATTQSTARGTADESAEASDRVEGLVRICEAAAWTLNLHETYQNMVDELCSVFKCEAAYLHLWAVTGDHLTRFASRGDHEVPMTRENRTLLLTTGRLMKMMEDHQPIIMDYANPHRDDEIPDRVHEIGQAGAVTVPMLADDEVMGIYTIAYNESRTWSDDGISYLLAIGRILGVSIQRVQMAKKNSELKVLSERKRLSAEIHDNLSQSVSMLKLGTETTLMAYDDGDEAAVLRSLNRLEAASAEMLKVLRDEILYLRSSVNQTEGLLQSVDECLSRFHAQWGIKVDLKTDGVEEPLVVPMEAELQITRILHESLSNVLRHSGADSVCVVIKEREGGITMDVQDNGRGFNEASVSAERLGIRIMKERAESLGGSLAIHSVQGEGTTVSAEIPSLAW